MTGATEGEASPASRSRLTGCCTPIRGRHGAGTSAARRDGAGDHPHHRRLGQGKAAVILNEDDRCRPRRRCCVEDQVLRPRRGGFGGERRVVYGGVGTGSRSDGRSTSWSCRSRRCCTACAGTANPLHRRPTPDSPLPQAFPQPILHGLCTYGMTCKALVDKLLDGDASRRRLLRRTFRLGRLPPLGETIPGQRLARRRTLRRRRHRSVARQPNRAVRCAS